MIDPKKAFRNQKRGAKDRGIEFRLTFEQWLEFWGDDLPRRGRGANDLQMQRFGDVGAYEIGNIKKGYPRENARTAGVCKRTRRCLKRAAEHQDALDQLIDCESADDVEEDEFAHLGFASSYDRQYSFAIDKDR